MAHPHLATTLAAFQARIHKSKNRLVSIPATVQRDLGLKRQSNNHVVFVSIRKPGSRRRWNHHYLKLTHDNEFAIPVDIPFLKPGETVQIRVHRIISDTSVTSSNQRSPTSLLLELARRPRSSWRRDGSTKLDDYLNQTVHEAHRLR
jgi:hypothetical protein